MQDKKVTKQTLGLTNLSPKKQSKNPPMIAITPM